MWLEELVWLWLPIAGAVGLWMLWSLVTLKRDLRAVRQRLAQLEAASNAYANPESTVV